MSKIITKSEPKYGHLFNKAMLTATWDGTTRPVVNRVEATTEELELYTCPSYRLRYHKRISGFSVIINVYAERLSDLPSKEWKSVQLAYNLDATQEVRDFWAEAATAACERRYAEFDRSITSEMEYVKAMVTGHNDG